MAHDVGEQGAHRFDSLWRMASGGCMASVWFGVWGSLSLGLSKFEGIALLVSGTAIVAGCVVFIIERAPRALNQAILALFAIGMAVALGYAASIGAWSLERALGLS